MLSIVFMLLLSFSLKAFAVQETLPSFLKICHRNDPQLNNCIKESVEHLRPLLVKGIPEFGIPTCEPLHIPEVIIDQGSGAFSMRSTYKNILVYGPSRFVIKSVKIDLEKDRGRIKLFLPQLQLSCHYTMQGRILMVPIAGNGTSYGNYSDIDATIVMQGQKLQKDNETYYNIKDFFVDFNIGHASIHLDDLFNGDKEMGEAMNLFLNDNWRSVANEMKPVLEDTIAGIFKKFSNKIYHKYPISILLPP